MEMVLAAGVLLGLGAFAGLLAGLLGVGGGVVLVPGFFYLFRALGYGGVDLMQVCLATSLATIVVTSVRSVMSHHRKGAVEWWILRAWGPWIMVGSVIGLWVAQYLGTVVLQAIFGVLAFAVAVYLGFGRSHWRFGARMPGGWRRMVMAPLVGVLSVLMGIGGGSFGVPVMTLYSVPMHRAVATAAGFGALIALPSAVGFLFARVEGAPPLSVGAVNLPAFAIVIAMTLLTAPRGAALAHRLDPVRLRRVFAVFLGVVALNMLREALGAF